ncbi:MAG TPA: phosphate ABC transporter substrate-binding protein [Rhodocyclaceae bacterium]|nr:phosphate ABC transporter substrate-binding protein [Rhodocyclaceae bacterium]
MRAHRKPVSLLAAGLLILGVAPAALAEVVVIANPATQVAATDVEEIFLGEKQFAGSTKLVPVDNGPQQEAFLGKVLKLDSNKYNSKWAKKSFREGLNPPAVKSGDAEVIDYVKRTPGAIGYVASAPTGVTVVQKY